MGGALVTLSVAAVAGTALGNLAPPASGWAVPLAIAAVGASGCALHRHPRGRWWWAACGVLLGALACALAPRPAVVGVATPVRFTAVVRDGWSETARGWRTRVRVERLEAGQRALRTAGDLDLFVGGSVGLADLPAPGSRVAGSGELATRSDWPLARPMLRVKTALLLADRSPGPLLDRGREAAMRAVQRAAGVNVERIRAAGLAGALALGRTEALPAGELADLRRSGLAHILAVSGMNVGMVAAMAWGALLLVGIRPTARRWILVPVVLGFCVLAGADAPVRRATAALVAYLLARQLGRPLPALPTAWAVVAGLTLAEPGALLQAGFLLSATITLALLRWVEPVARALHLLPVRLAKELAVVGVAQVASMPLVGAFFGSVPPLGMLVNLLASPLAFALMALALAAVAAAPLWPAAGGVTLSVLALLQHGLDGLAGLGGNLAWPFAPLPGMVAVVVILVAVIALLPGRVAMAGAVAALLFSVGWLATPAWRVPTAEARLLGVGQGMALLFRTPQAALLIDAGRSPGEAARELARLRVRRLDALILTHPDEDHTGGAGQILERVRVGELAFPNACADRPETVALRRRALLRGVPVRPLGPGDSVRAGDIFAEVLWPPTHLAGGDNDASLVARITVRGVRVLVSGDLEADGERVLLGGGVDLRAEVLQLGHHGSRTSSTWEFLRAVDPVVALAPTGARPVFAYPHPEVAARVRRLPALVVVQSEGIERLSWVDSGSVVVDTAEPVLVRCRRRGGHGD